MNATLTSLTPEKFMQLGPEKIDTNAHIVSFYGRNGSGKSSYASLYTWIMYDKHVRGKDSGPWIKTTKDGEVLHRLAHGGEAVLQIGNHRKAFKKVYHEIWSAPRGTLIETCSAHESVHWIDGGKFDTKREYEAEIARLCRGDVLRMLTDPTYFISVMKTDAKRAILLKLIGNVSDAEVIASNKKLKDLPKILDGQSLEDFRRKLKSSMSGMASDIKEIPTKIVAKNETLVAVPDGDHAVDLTARQTRLAGLQTKRAQAASGEESARIATRLAAIATEMAEIQTSLVPQGNPARDAALKQQSALSEQIGLRDSEVRELTRKLNDQSEDLTRTTAKIAAKLAEYGSENEKVFRGAEVCPTCEQALPAERVESTRAAFNHAKSQLLEKIIEEGRALRAKAAATQEKIDELSKELTAKVSERDGLIAAKASLVFPEVVAVDPQADPRYVTLATEKAELTAKKETLRTNSSESLAEIDADIAKVQWLINESQSHIATIANNEKTQAQIDALLAQEKALAKEYEALGKHQWLCEEFVRTECSFLTSRINALCEVTEWVLFVTQVNGGIEEVCIATYKGEAPSDGQKILCGLDMINVFGRHYDVYLPIVIDNAEAVTNWTIETTAQQLRFIATKFDKDGNELPLNDKSIRVELSGSHPALPKSTEAPVQDSANLFEREPVGATEPF